MKTTLLLLLAVVFCSCAHNPGPVTRKPDIGRVIVANEKTKQRIRATGEKQKELQQSQTKVSGSLQSVIDDLNKLLKP